jgi:hypothetical protein
MPRIRSIKPEIWSSPQVMNLSRDARLLFIGLITQADDEGRGTADVRKLSGTIFPGDRLSAERVRKLLDEVQAQRLVELYNSEQHGRLYLLPAFRKHQVINKPRASSYPEPKQEQSGRTPVVLPEQSGRTPEGSDPIRSDRNGMEGKDRNTTAAQAAERLLDLKLAYPHRAGGQPWRRALKALNARLADGFTWAEILDGVRRYATYVETTGKAGTEFVMQAATFLGPERHFLTPWAPPPTKAEQRLAANVAAGEDFLRRTEPAS